MMVKDLLTVPTFSVLQVRKFRKHGFLLLSSAMKLSQLQSRPRKPQPTWSCPPGSCAPSGKLWGFTLNLLNFLEALCGVAQDLLSENALPMELILWRFHGRVPAPRSCSSLATAGLSESGLVVRGHWNHRI